MPSYEPRRLRSLCSICRRPNHLLCVSGCVAASAAITCAAIPSPGENDGGATWETTDAGDGVVWGTCLPGYTGNATRTCTAVDGVGIWSPVDTACERTSRVYLRSTCTDWMLTLGCRQFCRSIAPAGHCDPPEDSDLVNATFATTAVGTYAVGTCIDGLFGVPRRLCQEDLTWSDAVINPCSRALSAHQACSQCLVSRLHRATAAFVPHAFTSGAVSGPGGRRLRLVAGHGLREAGRGGHVQAWLPQQVRRQSHPHVLDYRLRRQHQGLEPHSARHRVHQYVTLSRCRQPWFALILLKNDNLPWLEQALAGSTCAALIDPSQSMFQEAPAGTEFVIGRCPDG